MSLRARDIFIDRICDDLSEVILQYLPIEDKFRFECVSKQFQMTIFQRHHTLVLSRYVWNSDFWSHPTLCSKKLKKVLKKLPNIRRLEHKPYEGYNHLILKDRDIKLIMKYCNNLVEIINCDFFVGINGIQFFVNIFRKKFVKKFGLKFVTITANKENLELIGKSFTNIRELNDMSHLWSTPVNLPFKQLFELNFKYLKKLSLYFPEKEFDKQLTDNWKIFIENHKSLTHLSLRLRLRDEDMIYSIISQITELHQLVSLKIEGYLRKDFLIECLKQIRKSCPKIKSLGLSFITYDQRLEDLSFINEIKKFKQLRRLGIEIQRISISSFDLIDDNWNNSVNRGFQNLTHLKLIVQIDGFTVTDPTLIRQLYYHFPNLRELVIRGSIRLTFRAVQNVFLPLSKLETLDIEWYESNSYYWSHAHNYIKNSIQDELKYNCKRLKTICIHGPDPISDEDLRICSVF